MVKTDKKILVCYASDAVAVGQRIAEALSEYFTDVKDLRSTTGAGKSREITVQQAVDAYEVILILVSPQAFVSSSEGEQTIQIKGDIWYAIRRVKSLPNKMCIPVAVVVGGKQVLGLPQSDLLPEDVRHDYEDVLIDKWEMHPEVRESDKEFEIDIERLVSMINGDKPVKSEQDLPVVQNSGQPPKPPESDKPKPLNSNTLKIIIPILIVIGLIILTALGIPIAQNTFCNLVNSVFPSHPCATLTPTAIASLTLAPTVDGTATETALLTTAVVIPTPVPDELPTTSMPTLTYTPYPTYPPEIGIVSRVVDGVVEPATVDDLARSYPVVGDYLEPGKRYFYDIALRLHNIGSNELNGQKRFELELLEANSYLFAGCYRKAVDTYDDLLSKDKNGYMAKNNRAVAYMNLAYKLQVSPSYQESYFDSALGRQQACDSQHDRVSEDYRTAAGKDFSSLMDVQTQVSNIAFVARINKGVANMTFGTYNEECNSRNFQYAPRELGLRAILCDSQARFQEIIQPASPNPSGRDLDCDSLKQLSDDLQNSFSDQASKDFPYLFYLRAVIEDKLNKKCNQNSDTLLSILEQFQNAVHPIRLAIQQQDIDDLCKLIQQQSKEDQAKFTSLCASH